MAGVVVSDGDGDNKSSREMVQRGLGPQPKNNNDSHGWTRNDADGSDRGKSSRAEKKSRDSSTHGTKHGNTRTATTIAAKGPKGGGDRIWECRCLGALGGTFAEAQKKRGFLL
jgi:hypothetical protein